MKKYLLLIVLGANTGCSNISDILEVASLGVRSGVVQHAIVHSTAGSTSGTSTAVAAGAAITLAIQTPAVAENGAAVPITIVGLDLVTGESARVYADNCEVMEITNHGDATIQSLSTQIKMNKTTDTSAIIRVESVGREAQSTPFTVAEGGEPCNQNLGFNSVSDIDFGNYDEALKNANETITLEGSHQEKLTDVKAAIIHPMETGHNKPAHYITHISVLRHNQELVTIKSTPSLSKNPQIAMVFESDSTNDEYMMLWRDNQNKVDKNTIKIQ